MSVIGILLCGGNSQRMGFNKLTTSLGGSTALARSAALLSHSGCDRLVIDVRSDTRPAAEALDLSIPVSLCDGGSTRGQSVLNALRAADGQPGDIAVIHDAARCFQTEAAVRAAIAAGELDPARFESYQKLRAETADRADLLRRKKEWSKTVAKANKQRKKEDR